MHIIAGTSDQDQASEGDFLPKNDRYRRAGEYLDVMRKLWTSDSPIDHHGEFYRLEGGYSDIKPFQQPFPPLFFGGSSEGALEMGAKHCDVFAIFGEPLKPRRGTGCRISAAAPQPSDAGSASTCRCVRSWRPPRARPGTRRTPFWPMSNARPARRRDPTNHSSERLLGYAARGDVHDERLWMGIARATGAPGNTSCLVGTPDQIAAAVLEYYRLGIHSFLLRGFENPHDTIAIGRDLIPLIKAGAIEIDQQAEAAE